jgi:hypothetical protein
MSEEPEPEPERVPPPTPVTLRRAPRFGPFIASGAGLGALAALAVSLYLPDPQNLEIGVRSVAGYLMAIGGLLGGVIGGALAVLADRRR